jgi:DNA repair exonuclease SbcCD nuclease subunit
MHAGVQTANMGHYVKDTSSLPPECFSDYRVISGHYHARQDIKCGKNTFSYIGNPYTLTFGEAKDPPKGFQVLYEDGSLGFVPTNLRKHLVIECNTNDVNVDEEDYNIGDLVWLKVSGTRSELDKLKKKDIALFETQNFKLDKIPTDAPKTDRKIEGMSDGEILDGLIDNLTEKGEQKTKLKNLWKDVIWEA